MKSQVRVLGIDDSPFKFGDKEVLIVGVVMRTGYIDGIMTTTLTVDGKDGDQKIIEMVNKSKYFEQLKVIFLDGVALGGFNVIDVEKVERKTGIPIVTVTRNKPDLESMKKALQSHFEDWERRWELINRGELKEIPTEHKPIFIRCVGIELGDAVELIRLNTVKGAIPEPLRIAHLIATAVMKGESRGGA
jgi:endonuclease V-like protein UPF0215 family